MTSCNSTSERRPRVCFHSDEDARTTGGNGGWLETETDVAEDRRFDRLVSGFEIVDWDRFSSFRSSVGDVFSSGDVGVNRLSSNAVVVADDAVCPMVLFNDRPKKITARSTTCDSTPLKLTLLPSNLLHKKSMRFACFMILKLRYTLDFFD